MKIQYLLLPALFLFTINMSNAQSIKKQTLIHADKHDIHRAKEHSLKKIGTDQSHHLEETALAMESQRSSQSVNPPAANSIMATIYVNPDATGNNDGTSWENAFTDLQDALSTAPMGDQIWVATGTYFPGTADSSTFHLSYDLELYGGFAGTESSIDDRDIENNPTILSGDLNDDDVDDDFVTNREDNVRNVMRIENTVTTVTIIDGFTIQSGQADGDTLQFTEVRGGGVMSFGAAQFFNCRFRQNYATYYGGGLYFCEGLSAGGKVVNCLFEKNEAREEAGGGLVAAVVSAEGIEVDSCQFTDNHAIRGAGAYFLNSQVIISNSEFTNNTSVERGGAIYNYIDGEDEDFEISNATFTNNTSEGSGGAIYNYIDGEDEDFEISNSTFTNNTSEGRGGAIRIIVFTDNTTSNIYNCTFENNEANAGGAVAWAQDGMNNHISFTGCGFQNNNAIGSGADGGAINYSFRSGSSNSSATVDSCSFVGNSSQLWSGAIANVLNGANNTSAYRNSTFTANVANDAGGAIYDYPTENNGSILISDCIFENNESTLGGALICEVESGGQDHQYLVKNCNFNGNKSSAIVSGVNPSGGGIEIFFDNSQNNLVTIDSCHFEDNESEYSGGGIRINDLGSSNVVDLQNTTFISNITTYGAGVQDDAEGSDHQVNVFNCDFIENVASEFGGGFRTESQDANFHLTVEDCLFEGNNAFDDGGGLEVAQFNGAGCELEIRNAEFLNNTSGNQGAGLNFWTDDNSTANIHIERSKFDGNFNDASGNAVEGAGGFSLNNFGNGVVEIDIKSSIFENNVSEDGAGAIQLYKIGTAANDIASIENNLFANNSGGDHAGGIGVDGIVSLSVKSTTIADNANGGISLNDGSMELQNTILYNPGSNDFSSSGEYSVISLGGNLVGDTTMNEILTGTDIENEEPLFVGSGDYQLTENSPAVDKGILTNDVADFDLEGNDRVNGCLDIGAFESPFLVSGDCITSTKVVLLDNTKLSIYPNPVSDLLNVQLDNDWNGDLQIQIVNALGQQVYAMQLEKTTGEETWLIKTYHLSKGVYQLIVSNGSELMVKSFFK